MKLRRQKPARRESLVARETRIRKERDQTQGWDRFHVRTVGPGSLKGPDGLWEGKWIFAGDRLIGIVRHIRPDTLWPRSYFRVFIERPWEYSDLPRQVPLHADLHPRLRAGITEHGPR